MEKGLGTMVGETDIIPMKLVIYPNFAEVDLMMKDHKSGNDESSEIVVLGINADSIEDACLEPYNMENGHAYRYICTCIIDSPNLVLAWAGHIFPLNEFMDAYNQARDQGIAISESEIVSKCVGWYMTESKKREALFNIMGRWVGHNFDDLEVLTGYSAELLETLWSNRESVTGLYLDLKESYEIGVILGMHENGYTIEEIQKKVNWQKQSIVSFLLEKGKYDNQSVT